MLIHKLRERLESNLNNLELQSKEPSTYSYMAGRIDEIKDILEWIMDLPRKDKIDEIIKKIEENNCQSYYSYMDFNYQELLKLRDIL